MVQSFDTLVAKTTTKKMRGKAARRAEQLLKEMLLSEVRNMAGKTQADLANNLGIRQPSLSKIEKQKDMQISTLRRLVKALGGELELLVRFPKTTVKLGQFVNA